MNDYNGSNADLIANNWHSSQREQDDLYECSKCQRRFCQQELDDDAGEAFEHVCRECADAEAAQAAEEDAAFKAQAARNDAFVARVRAMSAEECMAASIAAGIHNPDGTLTDAYCQPLDPRNLTLESVAAFVKAHHGASLHATAQAIANDFDRWWDLDGHTHLCQLSRCPNMSLDAAARETARLAWMAGAVRAAKEGMR